MTRCCSDIAPVKWNYHRRKMNFHVEGSLCSQFESNSNCQTRSQTLSSLLRTFERGSDTAVCNRRRVWHMAARRSALSAQRSSTVNRSMRVQSQDSTRRHKWCRLRSDLVPTSTFLKLTSINSTPRSFALHHSSRDARTHCNFP